MRRKYRKTGTVILSIFIAAVVCVLVAVFLIHQNGIRYIKSNAGIKYFGTVDKNTNISKGRLWLDIDAASVSLQKFYILEIKENFVFSEADENSDSTDILDYINNSVPEDIKNNFPHDNIIFNKTDASVMFKSETFEVLIKDHESSGNNIISGEIYAIDENTSAEEKWILVSSGSSQSSYKDFEVSSENRLNKYKGDVISFINKEKIVSASFVLKDGTSVNLYSVKSDIYRIDYDKGARSGDLYIGAINKDYQKDGLGIYYFNKTGDIYYGQFVKDERSGKCEFLSANGDSYSGYIENGKNNGEGVLKWHDGASYTGTFKDNMKHGHGINIFSDGSVYEGDYVNDVKHGTGKYTWVGGDFYEGEFENDLYKGYGRYTWESGEYYEGDFKHNNLHGWGTYYWTSGRKFDGWWNLGKMVLEAPDDLES